MTDQSPLRAGPPATQIAAALKARLIAGALRPGQRLTEMDLAEEFGVGRSRIRETFRLLVGEGHLEFVANRGVLVRRYGKAELLEMGRAREVLESLAARLAAERPLSEAQRAELEAAQARMDAAEAAVDLPGYYTANRAYHTLIEGFAGNRHVAALIERVRTPLLGLGLPRGETEASIRRSNQGHRFITFAILAQAPEVAEAAMRAHVREGNDHIASLPDSAFGG